MPGAKMTLPPEGAVAYVQRQPAHHERVSFARELLNLGIPKATLIEVDEDLGSSTFSPRKGATST